MTPRSNRRRDDETPDPMTRSDGGKGPSQRMLRVGEQVRHALADVLQRGEVH